MTHRTLAIALLLGLVLGAATPAASQSITRVYTTFDAEKCKHTRGRAAEDYGFWRCPGHAGIDVVLGAGDQRMQVSFGRNALREPAAQQTFPAFNDVYKGTIEWRLETLPDGKIRPFATILRWNVKLADEIERRTASGRVLVVTRLNRGGLHVGYVVPAPTPMPTSWRSKSPISMRGARAWSGQAHRARPKTPGLICRKIRKSAVQAKATLSRLVAEPLRGARPACRQRVKTQPPARFRTKPDHEALHPALARSPRRGEQPPAEAQAHHSGRRCS